MFAYIEKDSYLHRRNPVIKFALIMIMTLIVSFSYFPVLPFLTFLISFFATWILGKIPLVNLFRRLLVFICVSVIFTVSMLILRGIGEEPDVVLRFSFLAWTGRDLIHAFSLGLRILALVTMSMAFVLTTRPRDLVLGLILQCRLSPVQGYAVMATYRFLPELQSQVDTIHLAQEIRGIPWNKGVLSRFASPFRTLLPLLCVAARRGERVACAMESRGLGASENRTYYRRVDITKKDWLFLIGAVAAYGLLTAVLVKYDLYKYSFAAIR